MRTENGRVYDDNNNSYRIDLAGSKQAAIDLLNTLKNCSDCSGCSGCSDCLGCLDCSDCSGCSDCSDCSDCYGCSRCSRCSDCLDCSGCSDCTDCSGMAPAKVVSPVPVIEKIHEKIFAACSAHGALNMNHWHSCDTTHCRAGWVVTLAGAEGKALEERTSTLFAAQQIYHASGYDISPCRFFDGDKAAMDDMRRLAEEEAKSAAATN